MRIEDYQQLANRTAKVFDTRGANLNHAALGIGSEAGELSETVARAWMHLPFDIDNIPEELGDASWYAAYMCNTMGWRFEGMLLDGKDAADLSETLASAVIGRNPVAITLALNAFAGDILSIVKAHVIYGKELDETILQRKLALYVTTLALLADIHSIAYVEYVLAANIEKLQKRYPDKYSDTAAIERADKKAVLELVK